MRKSQVATLILLAALITFVLILTAATTTYPQDRPTKTVLAAPTIVTPVVDLNFVTIDSTTLRLEIARADSVIAAWQQYRKLNLAVYKALYPKPRAKK